VLPKVDPKVVVANRIKWAAKLEEERAAQAAHHARCMGAASWIADRGRNGELATFGLWVSGGFDPLPCPPSVWNVTSDWSLFAECKVRRSPAAGYALFDHYLFLSRESLTKQLSRLGTSAVAGVGVAQGGDKAMIGQPVMFPEAKAGAPEAESEFEREPTSELATGKSPSAIGQPTVRQRRQRAPTKKMRGFEQFWKAASHNSRTLSGPNLYDLYYAWCGSSPQFKSDDARLAESRFYELLAVQRNSDTSSEIG